MPDIATINHVGVTVTDIERSTPWYTEVFGLTKLMEETHPDGTGYVVVLRQTRLVHVHRSAHAPHQRERAVLRGPDRARPYRLPGARPS